jgi:C_GCAxxG_C_C family probable redox protein
MLDEKQLAQIHEAGFQAEKNERGCAQCILLAVKDRYDVPPEVFKAASGLSGGVALTGQGPCGAFLGGAMLISHMYGRSLDNLKDKRSMGNAAAYVRKFKEYFDTQYGSFQCADIQHRIMGMGGFRLYVPEEFQKFEALGGHDDKCTNVVGNAAVWLAKTIEEIQTTEAKA